MKCWGFWKGSGGGGGSRYYEDEDINKCFLCFFLCYGYELD